MNSKSKNFYVGELDWTYEVRWWCAPSKTLTDADLCLGSAEGWRLSFVFLQHH